MVFVFLSAFSTKSFAQDPNWSVNASNYQFSATYTTFLNVFGNNLSNTNDKVAAFVNGEIRGVGNLVYVPSADKYVAYLTIYANTNNETVDFKIYDSSFNSVFTAKQTAQFRIDANVGTVFQSFAISNENLSSNAILSDLNFKGITPISKVTSRKNSTSNNTIDTYDFLLPNGTDVTQLIPEFSVFFNANTFIDFKKQISGTSVVDFTNAVVYKILSQDEKVLEEFTINVLVATNTALTNTVITSNTPNTVLPKEIEVQFSNPITGFSREDFTLNNAVISKFTKIDSQNFNVEVIPFSNGDFTVAVKPAAVADTDNQVNNASNILSFKNDQKVPIINNLEFINQNGGEYFDITFSEEVLNLDITDFELTGTNSDGYFVSTLQTITSTNFRLNVPKINTKEGSVFLKLNTSTDITDLAGNKIIQQEVASYFVNNTALIAPVLVDVVAECNVTITEIPKITSAVSGEIIATTTDALSYQNQGEYIITWNFDLGNGTILQSEQKVIVKDDFAPEPTFLNDITAECALTITDIPTAFDFCAGTILGETTDPLSYTKKGEYSITWSFNDGNGNTSTATQKVTITDSTTPNVTTLPDIKAQCSVTLVVPTTTDNCAGAIEATTTDAVFYDTPGSYIVNWVFNDGNGNTTNALQNVIIDNSFAPIAPDLADIIAECSVNITDIPEAPGNGCSGKVIATTTDSLTYNIQGTYTIVWDFDYGNGMVLQSSQNVIIKDTTAPDIPVLLDIVEECSAIVSNIPTTTDNCAGVLTATTLDTLAYTSQGNYTINWVFNDGNGNISTAKQNVFIKDKTPPIAPILEDISGECSVTVLTTPTTTDNCGETILGTTTNSLSYSGQGTYAVLWSFEDKAGNITIVSQKIIVKDTTIPIIPVLPDIITECAITITNVPTTTDNCNGVITGTTKDALIYNEQGNYQINWLFDDGNGNTITKKQNVIVKDTVMPTIIVKDIEIKLNALGNASFIISDIDNGSFDNCAIKTYAVSQNKFTINDIGENTVVFSVTDFAGNTISENVKITVTQDALSTDNFTLDELSTYLYPNPSKNSIKISLGIEKANVHIYDMSGKLVQTNKNYISDKNIDISNLPIGVFIVRISNNNKLITKRLTKTE